jgi:creatinine amidohydrolase
MRRFGPHKFYVVNTGVSTCRSLEPARKMLAKEDILLEYLDLAEAGKEAVAKITKKRVGTHADEIETSMMLYIAPEVVHMERARRDIHSEVTRGSGLTRDPDAGKGIFSPTGAWGDPTQADAKKGRLVVEAIVENMIAFVDRFAKPGFVSTPIREKLL